MRRETDYYAPIFERLGLDPAHLTYDDIQRVPITPKEMLRDAPDAFVRRGSQPAFRTATTGTTGRPTSVMFSDHEMRQYAALAAISFLAHNKIGPEDVVQINTSARATLGNTCFASACQRIGALWTMGGLIDPALSLALLAEKCRIPGKKGRVSILSVYPSYLGKLVEMGLRLGYRAADFGLERIVIGGEIATSGLKARAAAMLLSGWYFRRCRIMRPPVGDLSLGDVVGMLIAIMVVPLLSLWAQGGMKVRDAAILGVG